MTGKPRACTSSGCGARTVARRRCRAHYQAAWKAGELGSYEKLPTRPRLRDRTICPPDHKHANATTCFIQHQCRCDPCMDHNTAREARRKKDIAYGRYDSGLVDAAPVREHLLMLGEFGLGYKRVAALAGLGITPVRTLIWGRQDPGPRKGEMQKRVSKRTAERILAVRPSVDHLAGGASVPARGAHRRVQALVARGWSLSKIARRIGWSGENFSAMMLRDSISASTYRDIADVYEALWDVARPEETHRDKIAASRARRHAADRGWAPPLAWDNIDTDAGPADTTESADGVDQIAVELACAGEPVPLGKAERRTAVQLLHAERLSDARIAQRLGIADRTVLRIREELGLPGWSLTQQKAAA